MNMNDAVWQAAVELIRVVTKQTLLDAASEVETHWNDASTSVNQHDQAMRSAGRLRMKAEAISAPKEQPK